MSIQPHDTLENLGAPPVEDVRSGRNRDKARLVGARGLADYHLVPAPGIDPSGRSNYTSCALDDLTGDNGIFTVPVPGPEIKD